MDGYEPAPYLAKLSNYLKTLQNISWQKNQNLVQYIL
jgi:hypothetical protein